jgi:hypothetical protein
MLCAATSDLPVRASPTPWVCAGVMMWLCIGHESVSLLREQRRIQGIHDLRFWGYVKQSGRTTTPPLCLSFVSATSYSTCCLELEAYARLVAGDYLEVWHSVRSQFVVTDFQSLCAEMYGSRLGAIFTSPSLGAMDFCQRLMLSS